MNRPMNRPKWGRPGLALILVASMAAPSALFAQETTTPAPDATTAPESATPAPAPQSMPVDCVADFKTLDADGNGTLSATEAPREMARAAIEGVVPGADGLTQEQFTQICNSPTWAAMVPEEGAPFEGANSFTEEQARERAMAWNVTDVSALTQDDKGIWRGTGMSGGASVSVAIDYKGNVVTTPAN